ncbi:NusB antitermination factor [Sporobacter termitidis DSM 10068]|uniref:Transcription antitermination protein NusB n=1 Tax=Sporobacter termitidis DSM 10068 TaxID=1123282 RepID=A0A1M5Y8G9_9FIRM|nr:transcription antitermination factor NusB [Sporobacter termitidis]SHI08219.1 NusB antitermination factor [Sporobacter termitidis DSM 10068]
MTRTAAREIAVRLCFGLSENPKDPAQLLGDMFDEEYYDSLKEEDEAFSSYPDELQMDYISRIIRGVCDHGAELDGYIEKYAVGWKFGRISRTAVAILKTAMFEIMYMPDVPNKAAINEAVELAKRYEEPMTVPFINGVLGSFSRSEATFA